MKGPGMNASTPSSAPRGNSENTTESSVADADLPVAPGADPSNVPGARKPAQPDRATGHYGPGYGDPTRHQGNDLPPAKETPGNG